MDSSNSFLGSEDDIVDLTVEPHVVRAPASIVDTHSSNCIEFPRDIFHHIVSFCDIKTITRTSITTKENRAVAFAKISQLEFTLGGAGCYDSTLRYLIGKVQYMTSLQDLTVHITYWAPLHHFYVFIAKVGKRLKQLRVFRRRGSRTVESASILPFLNPKILQVLHIDYDICVPLFILLSQISPQNRPQLRELTIPVHVSDNNDRCSAASPKCLGKAIAKQTGGLEVLRLLLGRDPSSSVPKDFKANLIQPIVLKNIKTLRTICFGHDSSPLLDGIFPEFRSANKWGELADLCEAKFGIPLNMLRFQYTTSSGNDILISAAGEHCRRHAHADSLQAIRHLMDACHSKYDKDLSLILHDFICIVESNHHRAARTATDGYGWVLDKCEDIGMPKLLRFPKTFKELIFSYLKISDISPVSNKLKPHLARHSSLSEILEAQPVDPKLISILLEDVEWCEKTEVDFHNPDPNGLSVLDRLKEYPAALATAFTHHKERVDLEMRKEGGDLLSWLYNVSQSRWDRDAFVPALKAAFELYGKSSPAIQSRLKYPSNRSYMNWFLENKELRESLAKNMQTWKACLNVKVVRRACFGDQDCDIDVTTLEEICEAHIGSPLTPLLSVKISEFIWLRMMGTYDKSQEQIEKAAQRILDCFPTLPRKLLQFLTGKTEKPLKSATKIAEMRNVLKDVLKSRDIDYTTLAIVAQI